MPPVLLTAIPFEPNVDDLIKRLRLAPDSSEADDLRRLVEQARSVARPKAMYKVCCIDERASDGIVVDGIKLTSRVLAANTAVVHRVFPFIATCGIEIEEWSKSLGDMLLGFYADAIKEAALRVAIRAACEHMEKSLRLENVSAMNPGSLKDWPIEEQRPLFNLLGDPQEAIGVALTESYLMFPVKSVSGLRFASEVKFENCQLCPRKVCQGRRAPFDPILAKEKYGLG